MKKEALELLDAARLMLDSTEPPNPNTAPDTQCFAEDRLEKAVREFEVIEGQL